MSTPSPILRSVCEQRDRAWEMIDTLISAFWSAHHNGAFEAEDQRYLTDKDGKAILGGTGEHKPYRCSAGRSLIDVFHGCDIFDSDRCRGFDCPLGFHHRYLYEKVRDAAAVLKEPRAERVPFDLSRIPQFDKDCAYTITPQWYARLFLAFFSDYRFGGDYTKDKGRAYGEAYYRLCRFALSQFGVSLPDDYDTFLSDREVPSEALVDLDPLIAKYGDLDTVESDPEFESKVRATPGFSMYWLTMESFILLCEYRFGKDYPDEDMGVYADAVYAISRRCVSILGLPPNDFDLIMNLNDASLDAVGFSAAPSTNA